MALGMLTDKSKYVSTGILDFDRMMGGGLISGDAHLLEVEPGTGEMAFVASFLEEGISHGDLCALIAYDRPHEDMIARLKEFGFDAEKPLRSGSLYLVDLCDEGKYDPDHTGPILMTDNLYDPNAMLRLYYDLAQITDKALESGEHSGARVVICSLSSQIMNYKYEPTYKAVKKATQIARQHHATSLTIINPKMFDETVVAAFEHLFDGNIMLTMKDVKGRFQRFIRVRQSPLPGFYADEVPYDIVNNKPSLVAYFAEPVNTLRDHLKSNADGTISLGGARFVLSNAELVNNLLDHAVKLLGFKTISEQVYNLYKSSGQTELKAFIKAMNIPLIASSPKNVLDMFAGYLSATGSGIAEMTKFANDEIIFNVRHSLCSMNCRTDMPMGQYIAGTLAGATELVLGKKVRCHETKCVAKGDDYCEFVCKVVS
jgi:KaiC/GvpD/RAD55 family RecA-like ATPase/predicted hydrocarbon binding protein